MQVDDLPQGNNPTATITEPKFSKFITNASFHVQQHIMDYDDSS